MQSEQKKKTLVKKMDQETEHVINKEVPNTSDYQLILNPNKH